MAEAEASEAPEAKGAQPTWLIAGKAGSGKSSTANNILTLRHGPRNDKKTTPYSAAHSFNSSEDNKKAKKISNGEISVVRCPDPIHKKFCGHLDTSIEDEVASWLDQVEGEPQAIIFLIRCDKRFTREDKALYEQLKNNEGLKKLMQSKLVVVFTMGDRLYGRDLLQDLVSDDPYLQPVQDIWRDAGKRYVVFDNTAKKPLMDTQVGALKKVIKQMEPHPFPQHICRLLILKSMNTPSQEEKPPKRKTPVIDFQDFEHGGLFVEMTFVEVYEEHSEASDPLKLRVKVAISPGPHAICASPQESELVSQLLGSSADDLRQYTMDQKVERKDLTNNLEKVLENKEFPPNNLRGIFFQNETLKKIDEEIHDDTERNVEGRWYSLRTALRPTDSPYKRRLSIKRQRMNEISKHPQVENTHSE